MFFFRRFLHIYLAFEPNAWRPRVREAAVNNNNDGTSWSTSSSDPLALIRLHQITIPISFRRLASPVPTPFLALLPFLWPYSLVPRPNGSAPLYGLLAPNKCGQFRPKDSGGQQQQLGAHNSGAAEERRDGCGGGVPEKGKLFDFLGFRSVV